MNIVILAEPDDDDDEGQGKEEGRESDTDAYAAARVEIYRMSEMTEAERVKMVYELFGERRKEEGIYKLSDILRGRDTFLPETPDFLPSSPSSSRSSAPHCVCSSPYHEPGVYRWVQEQIEDFRTRIGVDPQWSIELQVCCPGELGQSEATIEWDAEVWYARLRVRCDLPVLLMVWVLAHELYELFFWRTGNVFLELLANLLSDEMTQFLERQYRIARNQEIEVLVSRFLEVRRPHHLLVTQEGDDKDEARTRKSGGERGEEEEEEEKRRQALLQIPLYALPERLTHAVSSLLEVLLFSFSAPPPPPPPSAPSPPNDDDNEEPPW